MTSSARTEKRAAKPATTATSGRASSTPSTAPAPQSTRLSASSVRRSAPRLAPSAARTASSPSRRTERARIRLATFEQAITNTTPAAASSSSRIGPRRRRDLIAQRRRAQLHVGLAVEYDSGCSLIIAACTAVSSARAASSVAPGARRPKSSVIRCVRVRDHRRAQVMRAGHDVRDDLGVGRIRHRRLEHADHRRACARRGGSVLPTTDGSLLSDVVQKRCVSTAAPGALRPSSPAFNRRPSTGRRPITSKNEPLTTPACTTRGSPKPIIVKSMVEKSPNAPMVVTRDLKSSISGTENVMFAAPRPGALWRM